MKDLNNQCLTTKEIDAYLSNNLSRVAVRRVEHHLNHCPLCSDAVEGYASTHNPSEHLQRDFSLSLQKEKSGFPSWWGKAVAAACVFAVCLAVFKYHSHTKNSFSIDTGNMDYTLRGDAETAKELREAINFYKQKDYAKSSVFLETYLLEQPENTEARFYLGLTYLGNNQVEEAIEALEIVRLNDSTLFEAATWNLALAYKKQGNTESSKAMLHDLLRKPNSYTEKANKLLKEISN